MITCTATKRMLRFSAVAKEVFQEKSLIKHNFFNISRKAFIGYILIITYKIKGWRLIGESMHFSNRGLGVFSTHRLLATKLVMQHFNFSSLRKPTK